MNPFEMRPGRQAELILDWAAMRPEPYDKRSVDPYTRTRLILMNGTEFENVWFSHQFSRHTVDNEVRRQLALIRRSEQQQQKLLCHLKPLDETMLEHTIGYEQLAVDLTAHLAKRVSDAGLKNALDFALLEDFDHLYRYANLMEMITGEHAERLVGRYTEIMPGRPTISEHRFPRDGLPRPLDAGAPLFDRMAAMIITAAEQQTMNYYMNVTGFAQSDLSRRLYQEIALIEEQHVSQYEALIDAGATWLECLLMHEYVECYLYWSCQQTEGDDAIRAIWARHLEQEIAHLHKAAQLLEQLEGKPWQQVIPDPAFPAPIRLESNIPHVRAALLSVQMTYKDADPVPVQSLEQADPFFAYQQLTHPQTDQAASHMAVAQAIRRTGRDYRFETAPHPVAELQSREQDNTRVGRDPQIPGYDTMP